MKFSHCYNASFCRRVETRRQNVQGVWTKLPKPLALAQSHFALKVLAFKACGFVPYAL